MRKIFALAFLLLCTAAAFAQQSAQDLYVRKWAPTAVREMYRSGVPASITLAQGLLESGSGKSALAAEGNNHFGIKCHKDWTGRTMAVDDDAKGECFRVYDSADDSFRDHSDFLRYRDRYKFLFEFETTDYKSWAYGLKKAGYATDPAYPEKLIKYIEDYKLYQYDTMKPEDFPDDYSEQIAYTTVPVTSKSTVSSAQASSSSKTSSAKPETTSNSGKTKEASVSSDKQSKHAAKSKKESKSKETRSKDVKKEKESKTKGIFSKKSKEDSEESIDNGVPSQIPASPLSLEEPKKISKSGLEEFQFSLSREMYSKNGVPFIYSDAGETYASIAESNNLFLKEILKFNDLDAEKELLPGTIVYLQLKKNQSEKGLDKYIVDDDSQSLWDICQRFAVRMSSVEKMNGITSDYEPHEGDTIFLRGHKTNE